MTINNLIEEVIQLFPKLGAMQVLYDLDRAQKEFANDTKILTKRVALSLIATTFSWTLPSDCIEVTAIELYDTNGLELCLDDDDNDVDLTYEIINGVITFYSLDETVLTRMPSVIAYAYIDYVYMPVTLTAVTDSLTIPEDFHEGLLNRLLAKYYARFPQPIVTQNGVIEAINSTLVTYWNNEFQKKRLEGKRWANIQKDNTSPITKKDTMGNPVRVRRTNTATPGTITI